MRALGAGFAIAITLVMSGCEVTAEKIASWKATERGPEKIRAAVRKGALSAELRGQALVALVELGMLKEASEELATLSADQRSAVIHAAAMPLIRLAQGSGSVDRTTRTQRNGKDGLFELRGDAAPADRMLFDDALIAWLTADLLGRMSEGGHSSEQILMAIGSRTGGRLNELVVDAGASEANRREAARLLGKVGDAAMREQAGAALVARARSGGEPEEALLLQIGLLGGNHAAHYLGQLAEDGHAKEPVRQKALFALAQGGDPAALATALRIAGDRHASGDLRDAAFELAEKIGVAAVPSLLVLMDDASEQVRWRAIEAALAAGKERAVVQVLERLSPQRSWSKQDLSDFVVHDLELIGPGTLPPLRQELTSKSWVARLVAVLAIGAIGKVEDAPRVEAIAADRAPLRGWKDVATIGAQAKLVAAVLRGKNH